MRSKNALLVQVQEIPSRRCWVCTHGHALDAYRFNVTRPSALFFSLAF